MLELIWLYLTALLHNRISASCIALAEALKTVTHDRMQPGIGLLDGG
jgi:hypothetical protein